MVVLENMDAPTMEAAPNASVTSNPANVSSASEEVPINPPRNLRLRVKELETRVALLESEAGNLITMVGDLSLASPTRMRSWYVYLPKSLVPRMTWEKKRLDASTKPHA